MAGRALLIVAFAVAVLVSVSGALAAARMSAPPPALSSLVLSSADFRSGAGVQSESTGNVGGIPAFIRVFKPGVIGATRVATTVSLALLEPDASSAVSDFKQFESEAQSRAGRQAIAKVWALAFVKGANLASHGRTKVVVKEMTVGAPVETGASALRLPLTVKTNLGAIKLSLQVVQADRALVIVDLVGLVNGRIASADAAQALAATRQHLQAAFTVASTAAPTINGTPIQGQLVTVDEGSWTGAPSAFSYSWSRCDTSGADCAPIAGATSSTYPLTAADAGSTLRVTVAATNSVSSQETVSSATAVVT